MGSYPVLRRLGSKEHYWAIGTDIEVPLPEKMDLKTEAKEVEEKEKPNEKEFLITTEPESISNSIAEETYKETKIESTSNKNEKLDSVNIKGGEGSTESDSSQIKTEIKETIE